jgi:hypothetical protein
MSYTQTRDANWQVPYVGGWCLKYVQDAFGTDHPYPTAIAAWNANYGGGNHPGELPPAGKTVAVYFSLGNVPAGHVAISLDDGSVASSTQPGSHSQGFIHPNLQNLIDVYGKYNGRCSYLGWSEYVGTVRVVQPVNQPTQGGDMADKLNKMAWQQLAHGILGRNGLSGRTNALDGSSDVTDYIGRELTLDLINELFISEEAKKWRDSKEYSSVLNINERLDSIPILVKENTRLTDEVKQAESLAQDDGAKISGLTAQLDLANATIQQLQAADKPEPTQPTGPVSPSQDTTTPDTSNRIQTLIKKISDALVSFFGGKKS